VIDTLRVGGRERLAVELANLMDPAEFEVSICATREGGPMAAVARRHVPVVVLGRRATWDPAGLARFGRLVRERGVDVLHSHGSGPARLAGLCRASRFAPARHLMHDHTGDRGGDGDPLLRLAARAGVDAVIGVSEPNCRWAETALRLPPGRVHRLPHGVDVDRFRKPPPIHRAELAPADGRLLVAMVAGFSPAKDHPTLLRALSAARHRDRLHVLLVGPRFDSHAGYHDRCLALVDELGLGGQVTWLGPRTDVPAVLAAVDAGVLTSRYESGPLALAEYLAAGLPYVVTATGEVTEAVRGTETGFVVPPGDAVQVAAALDRLVDLPPEGRALLGARGRALAEKRFDLRGAAGPLAAIYRALAGGGG